MRASLWIGFSVLSAGCAGKGTDTSGSTADEAACTETTQALSMEEQSPLGFSGEQILALTSGNHDTTLTWADGSTAALALTVSYLEGDITYVDRTVNTGGAEVSDTALGGGETCPDTLEIGVSVSTVTDDGALAETWDTTLVSSEKTSASFSASFDPLDMSGSYDITPALAGITYDSVTGTAIGALSAAGTSGVISAQATSTSDCGADTADCTTSATQIDIASWAD